MGNEPHCNTLHLKESCVIEMGMWPSELKKIQSSGPANKDMREKNDEK